MKRNIHYILITLVALFFLNSCSTTSRLAEGEVLYTGVKKVQYNQLDSVPIESGVKDNIFSAINVKPNNPLYSPYYRTPFPIGLWVYNHWDENATGLKEESQESQDSIQREREVALHSGHHKLP